MVVIIDNYDSFTYNLFQFIGEFAKDIRIFRNDEITPKEIEKLNPTHIVISPGPKTPVDAGNCNLIVEELHKKYPILGVCLGHQCIGHTFGGRVLHSPELMHGKSTIVPLGNDIIFKDLGASMQVARYHSLIVEKESLPNCFNILSETEDGLVMAMKHNDYPIYGLQFHPESILTINGKQIIKNFIEEVSL